MKCEIELQRSDQIRWRDQRYVASYAITRVHTNGNVTNQLSDHMTERINIRRIRPRFPLLGNQGPS